jgi:sugar (pentulose or hexulose) kinase
VAAPGAGSAAAPASIPRPHALAPASAPASSLAALVAAQLGEGREREREAAAGGGEKDSTPAVVGASDVCLSLSPSGCAGDESDGALFGAGSSATISDIAAAALLKRQKTEGGGIHDALGPLRVWYSVVGVKQ